MISAVDRVFYPVNVAHEIAHLAGARAFGGDGEIIRRPDGRLGVDIEFDDDVPTIGLVVTAIAPTLLGMVLLLLLGPGFAAAMTGQTGILGGIAWVIAFAVTLRFAWPSVADLAVPVAIANAALGGETTVTRAEVALLVGTLLFASVVFYSLQAGILSFAMTFAGVAGLSSLYSEE